MLEGVCKNSWLGSLVSGTSMNEGSERIKALVIGIWLSLLWTVSGQVFENLDFELASTAAAPPNYTPSDAFNPISAASALPFWSVSEDNTVCTVAWGSPVALDETPVALVSGTYSPIEGNYSVQLSAYADAPSGYYRSSSISQTGVVVPVGSRSIQFLIASPYQNIQPNPVLTLNGASIALREISQSGGVILWLEMSVPSPVTQPH